MGVNLKSPGGVTQPRIKGHSASVGSVSEKELRQLFGRINNSSGHNPLDVDDFSALEELVAQKDTRLCTQRIRILLDSIQRLPAEGRLRMAYIVARSIANLDTPSHFNIKGPLLACSNEMIHSNQREVMEVLVGIYDCIIARHPPETMPERAYYTRACLQRHITGNHILR